MLVDEVMGNMNFVQTLKALPKHATGQNWTENETDLLKHLLHLERLRGIEERAQQSQWSYIEMMFDLVGRYHTLKLAMDPLTSNDEQKYFEKTRAQLRNKSYTCEWTLNEF